ncbi:MAG: asparagine synthetase B family protein [Actinomycetota bacterium]
MPTSTATAEARPAVGHRRLGTAPDGWVVGVIGGPDPAAGLRRHGLQPAFAAPGCAMAGTVAVTDTQAVGGRIVVDRPTTTDALGRSGPDRLAALWAGGGRDAVVESRAMYGAAVHDRRSGTTTLMRDPLGERTLYLTRRRSDGSTWFADRLATLRALGVVGRELDLESLRHYLILAYVPGTSTMLADAEEVAPGTAWVFEPTDADGRRPGRRRERWWAPTEGPSNADGDDNADFAASTARLRTLLADAVDRRRPAGPVGVYLSGGVDSSAVTALLCRTDPSTVHTFAVHFGPDVPNELAFVDQVVERVRPAVHHEIELTPSELTAALPDTMAALDDPIGDPLTVPNLAIGRRAAEVVGTVFNGEGGDPIFGGPKNQPMLLAALYGAGERSRALDELYLRSYQKCHPDLDRLLTPAVRDALSAAPDPVELVAPYLSQGSMTHFVNRLYEANTRLKGSDHILTKVADLTAATGLVARSPLFDRAIVDAAFAMPPDHKLRGTVEKAVLKAAVADLLPDPVLNRPKAGMRVPVQTWFRGPLRRAGSRRLLSRRARIAPYLDRRVIKEWTRYDGDPNGRYGRKLWLLLSLEHWLDAHDAG